MVVLIVGMAAAIALPNIGNSMKGAKLRTAARDVVALNRYARKSAIMHQRYMVLLYDARNQKLELVPLESGGFQGAGPDPFASVQGMEDPLQYADASEGGEFSVVASKMKTRRLPDGVRLEDFSFDGEEQMAEDVYWVLYYPNGMCDGHAFALEDARRFRVEFDIQALTGEILVEQNW